MRKYQTISLPKNLSQKIQELINKHPELGYTSIAEFVKEAIRTRLEKLGEKSG